MSRVKRSVHARKKRRKVLKEAKGYYGRKHSSYRFAKEQVQRSATYAYRDRRNRKRDFRRLWITRINAAARLEGMSYSELIHGLTGPGSRSTARCWPRSRSTTAMRSADSSSSPGRVRPPSRSQSLHFPGRAAYSEPAFFCGARRRQPEKKRRPTDDRDDQRAPRTRS